MAIRIEVDDVAAILPSAAQPDDLDELTSFVTMASLIVDQNLTADSILSATELFEIERWLSAHLYVSTKNRISKSEGVDAANITYLTESGLGLNGSPYGQNVKLLDKTGLLATIGKRRAYVEAIESFTEDD